MLPVAASSAYTLPSLHPLKTASCVCPLIVALARTTFHAQSKSQRSCEVVWKPQTSLPLVSSIARIESLHKLGPGLVVALKSGPGCAVDTYVIPVFLSTAHVPPQPTPEPA